MQGDVPGLLAIRLRVRRRKIVEVEHVVATQRYLAPPVTVVGDEQVEAAIAGPASTVMEG